MTVAPETKKNNAISKPIISVKLQNKNCKALLDTGADVNVVSASLLNKMSINFQRSMPWEGCHSLRQRLFVLNSIYAVGRKLFIHILN